MTVAAADRQSGVQFGTRPRFAPATQTFILACLLAIVTVAVYYPVARLPFSSYDDHIYVYENASVTSGLHLETVRWAFTNYDAANWHPVTWLSHALDCQLFLLNPVRHHEVSLLFHMVNVLLLFWVLQRATGYLGRSAMVAALFALHPTAVESVAWISERKNLLSLMFFLLALGAYRWYASVPRFDRYLVVALLYALGLMSKPQVITFPCVLLLWDYWPLGRMFANAEGPTFTRAAQAIPGRRLSWLFIEKIPLFALSAASAVLTMEAQFKGAVHPWFPKSSRLANAIISYLRYLGKAVWPSNLAVFYPHSELHLASQQTLLSLAAMLLITLLVAVLWRRRYLTVGWLWFVGTLVPMIGLIQVGAQGMADRYAYLPFIGLFIMICWGAPDLYASLTRHQHRSVVWQAAVCITVLLALAVATRRQISFWDSDWTLWSHALQVTKRNWAAEDNLARQLINQGQTDEGMAHFYRALELQPHDPVSNLDVGVYEAQHGNPAQAIGRFLNVVVPPDVSPEIKAKALNDMGQAYRDLGDYQHAGQSFAAAVRLNPGHFGAWIGLGVMAQKVGKLDLAIKAYSRAMEIQPEDWGYLLLAGALEQSGRADEARAATAHAKSISFDLDDARRSAEQKLAR